MKKRILSLLLILCMAVSLLPTAAFAAEETGGTEPAVEEKIDTLQELQSALNTAAKNKEDTTVTLAGNITLEEGDTWTPVDVDGYNGAGVVTLNGGGHTITGLNAPLFAGGFGGESGIVINDLTLIDVSLNDTGSEYAGTGFGAFICAVDSMPTISLTECHVKGGTITSTSDARVGGLIGYTAGYNKQDDGPVDTCVTLKNCSVSGLTITANGSVGGLIGHAGGDAWTYSTITDCTVSSCTLTSTNTSDWRVGDLVGTANVGQVTIDQATVDNTKGNTREQKNATTSAIENGLVGRAVLGDTGLLVVAGKVTAAANTVAIVTTAQGKTTQHTSLDDAIKAANEGNTVKLVKDVTLAEDKSLTVDKDKDFTLDLNGFTISQKKEQNSASHSLLTNNGTLTITDSSEAKTGKITYKDTTTYTNPKQEKFYTANTITNCGTLKIQGGTIENTCLRDVAIVKCPYAIDNQSSDSSSATLTIENATIDTVRCPAIRLFCNSDKNDNKVTIRDSTVKGSIEYQNPSSDGTEVKGSLIIENGTFPRNDGLITSLYVFDGTDEDGKTDCSEMTCSISNGDFYGTVTFDGTVKCFNESNTERKPFIIGGSFHNGTHKEWKYPNTSNLETKDVVHDTDPSDYVVENGNTRIVKRDGNADANYVYTVLPKSNLIDGVYLTDPTSALKNNYYVSSTEGGVWTVRYSAPSSGDDDSDPTYAIEADKDIQNGEVTVSRRYAEAGDTVTITVKPDSGYVLGSLTVTDKNGDALKLTDKGDGKYTFTMPAGKVEITAVFTGNNPFTDVPAGSYYEDAVIWAAGKGITGGMDANHFAPDGVCTRAQAVTFLWRAAGSPAPKSTVMPFTDVPAGSYYYSAVLWAIENGITNGTSDTTFSPDADCTRAQIVTFLYRAEKSPAAGSSNPFTDVAAGAYYADAVLWAVKENITNGSTPTTFSPDANCTRAQIVTFLYRCMK